MKKRASKLFLGRKADTNAIYQVLIQILIALAVYITLQLYIDSVAKDTLFEKYYLSNDLSLLAETIYAGQGDLRYYYSNDKVKMDKFSFDFRQQKVNVVENEGNLPIPQPYGEDTKLPYSGLQIKGKNEIILTKTRDKLEIS